MKTAEANFHFPVLGFTPDREIWGFQDLDTLTSCGPRTLKDDMQVGMELIDSEGRRCVVRAVRRTGRDQPLLPWLVSWLLTAVPGSRIEHELDELQSVSLSEIKERACASVQATSSDYCADDEWEEVLVPLLAQVRAAESVARIHDLLGLDSFKAY
jgi:hypothetical protein